MEPITVYSGSVDFGCRACSLGTNEVAAVSDYLWYWGFWTFFILIAVIEYVRARGSLDLQRKARWPINFGFGLINSALFTLLPVGLVVVAQWEATNKFGLFHQLECPVWLIITVSILTVSFGQYVFHRCAHKVPVLWAIHRVHHSDMQLDSSTQLRFHPLEFVVGLVFLMPLVITMGLDPKAIAAFQMIEIVVGVTSHTSIVLSASTERILGTLFITPGLHHMHHSRQMTEANTNFGGVFSFWDRIFGTYSAGAHAGRNIQSGVIEIDSELATNFDWLLVSPWRAR